MASSSLPANVHVHVHHLGLLRDPTTLLHPVE